MQALKGMIFSPVAIILKNIPSKALNGLEKRGSHFHVVSGFYKVFAANINIFIPPRKISCLEIENMVFSHIKNIPGSDPGI